MPKKKTKKDLNKTKCPKCRKKVNTDQKEDGEIICKICGTSLGFIVETTPYNYFVEMVQVYLDYKKIKAKATLNEDKHLDIQIDFDKENHQELADLLSKCMPISYVITNTALKNEKKAKGVKSISVETVETVDRSDLSQKKKKQVKEGQTGLERFL